MKWQIIWMMLWQKIMENMDLEKTENSTLTVYWGDIVNIGLHFILKNVRPYAAPCSEA